MNWKQPKIYAAKHKDESTRAASRSGGIFTALSDQVLSDGGIVYGCVLTDDFSAVHVRAEDTEERDRMRGSKYIQSKLGETFKNVKEDLDIERKVLFSGTSCQVAGLKKFLGKKYENLFCVDIVCHGVPSKKIWAAYLYWQQQKNHSKIVNVDFRNKKDFGWREHVETLQFDNGRIVNSRVFKSLFYRHVALRPSCYECPYKSIMHPGDISIADYWRIEVAAPELDDNKGVSLVLVNNEVGEKLFESVEDNIVIRKTRIVDSMQQSFKAPYPKPSNRNQFWTDFYQKPFGYVAKKYGNYGFINDIKTFYRNVKKKIKGKVGG